MEVEFLSKFSEDLDKISQKNVKVKIAKLIDYKSLMPKASLRERLL